MGDRSHGGVLGLRKVHHVCREDHVNAAGSDVFRFLRGSNAEVETLETLKKTPDKLDILGYDIGDNDAGKAETQPQSIDTVPSANIVDSSKGSTLGVMVVKYAVKEAVWYAWPALEVIVPELIILGQKSLCR